MYLKILVAGLITAAAAMAAPCPNILVILCDDLGYADVGFNGAEDIKTPHLDRLAEAGTICTSAYVAHPFCGPSRMGLMTGRYPHEYGGQFNHPPFQEGLTEYDGLGVPVEETLIAEVLQKAGYFTGAIGKWHLGTADYAHPNVRGFDEFYGFLGGGHMYFPEKYEPAYQRQKKKGIERINEYLHPLEYNGKAVTGKGYLTDELTGEAVRFVTEAAGKQNPFFLYLAYNAPHAPMEATPEDLAVFSDIENPKRRTYAAMVYAVDRGIARIVETLKKNGQLEDTLIIFLSDNGGKPSQGASNKPLRGRKGDTWEGGFRVPMMWYWPGKIPAGTVDFPVSSLDFYPTFAALAGGQIPPGKKLDGKNIFQALETRENPRKGEMIYAARHRSSYTDIAARRDEWKITKYGNQPWRLYKITEDPGEENDLAQQYPERVKEMVRTAKKWSTTHAEPLFFHAAGQRDSWAKFTMPNFDRDFVPAIGAPALAPPAHITDQPGRGSGIKLKKGDSTLEQYIAREKIKWASKGWKWDQDAVIDTFRQIDTNGDGIISGVEKKIYWSKEE
ncbi:sulfatase-like hydrolase/transferase [Pontiella agarivorans]|uniref:Sulfatase-like hydrolase/transferase n=1 Tax=Pontiella agarivorans TaxID=3038953 RepID=A0ABU5MWA4_9BACT|nr:sulfatase-like hydrolase/transferase [Pontiella agarivorans]MDZ8118408.1 sulfatase-like hydrolase/transferase [Pontiella agarivorans]